MRGRPVTDAYREDLAYIHDAGFGGLAQAAAPVLLDALRHRGFDRGLVVDLGCGSGIFAKAIADAGYDVVGIDLSPSMIALARDRVPAGDFRVGSLLKADLPRCVAVTAIGECFNYLFDRGNTESSLARLFKRIHGALEPGGALLFDIAGPGRVRGTAPQRSFRESDDWAVLVHVEEDRDHRILTRRITSFRRVGELYRRDQETHRQRLIAPAEPARALRAIGFRVRILRGYGAASFRAGQAAFLARKP
jgi:SAM-dependent methyltransferase